MENVIVFGIIAVAVIYLVRRWFGKGRGSCGCGCDCTAAKDKAGSCKNPENGINDLRQK
ncbi:FeoB-associated Cys-rich membrane protein [Maridesulfovibrio sp.]|uniref:FeoB-associated Cys-rich membrane protein n=1 Tax=Maridesulfovibrio sp. TaxID=2795000 RepID=UPI0029C9CFF8|nr:FeoB-associated Cys-rich membrane protein [Maridesulfovibrio sp.]